MAFLPISRPIAALAPLLLLAGCGEADLQENNSAPEEAAVSPAAPPRDVNASTGEPLPQPNGMSGQEEPPAAGGSLPPAGEGLRFVGFWAAEPALCADKAWRFTANSLTTPAHSVCRFTNVKAVPGGYDIAARCTAEGPETADELRIRFAETARAMMFESDVIADAGLIWCGARN